MYNQVFHGKVLHKNVPYVISCNGSKMQNWNAKLIAQSSLVGGLSTFSSFVLLMCNTVNKTEDKDPK